MTGMSSSPSATFRLTHPSRPASKSVNAAASVSRTSTRPKPRERRRKIPSGSAILSTYARDIAATTHASTSRWCESRYPGVPQASHLPLLASHRYHCMSLVARRIMRERPLLHSRQPFPGARFIVSYSHLRGDWAG